MEKVFALLGLTLVLMFSAPLFGCLFGGMSGWVAGLFFEEEILGFLRRLGADTKGMTTWQVGAAMGFLGGFLKTSVTKKD